MKSRAPTRILCLGGGWGALYLTRQLRGAIKKGLVEVTVVSRDNFHTFHGFIGEMLVGRIQPGQITNPARRMFPPARFHNAEIERIDVERQVVVTSRLLDGKQQELGYDHLVIALGSVDDLSRYPGISQHTLRLKTYWDCFKVRNHLLSMMEMAEIEEDPIERRRLLTFVVVGANFGGVEVVTELEDYFHTLAKREYAGIRPEEVRVVCVHAGDTILPELATYQPKLVAYATKVIAKAGIEMRLKTCIAAATPEEAILDTGERIATRSIISCAGNALSPLLDTLPYDRDDRGRIFADEFLHVRGVKNVWTCGDCAAVTHPKGGTCPGVAVFAMAGGKQIGKNILRELDGKPSRKFTFEGLGDACSLGRRRAITHVKGIRLYGVLAWVVWRTFFLYFMPTWDRRIRVLLDWLLTLLFGRDIVNLRMAEPYGLRSEHYEPGQVIVKQGAVGQQVYVIFEGEAEVIREEPGGEKVVATLGKGDHFGEVAVFERRRRTATVRARTKVELISLGSAEALALSETVHQFGETIRRSPRGRDADPPRLPAAGN
jgi:NADH:ubiquinone reductase (H+-translocating)